MNKAADINVQSRASVKARKAGKISADVCMYIVQYVQQCNERKDKLNFIQKHKLFDTPAISGDMDFGGYF